MPDARPLGLYIHIPFCKKKCPYCAFYKEIWKPDYETEFINALKKDISSYRSILPKISTIFLGGGTPTILSHDGLKQLFDFIYTTLNIAIDCEITIEANPETITPQLLTTLEQCGINRLSLGVQSMNQNELDFLGRWHSADTITSALYTIRSHKKNWNLNIDLIFSTPNSTNSTIHHSLQTVLKFAPQHLSTYGLTIEPHTLFDKKKINPLPDEKELIQFETIMALCTSQHFDHYEVSAFAKPGFQCKHNLIYWNFEDFIGIGPSATSFFNNYRFAQPSSLSDYLHSPLSPFIENKISPSPLNDLIIEYIIAQLRLDVGINKKKFHERFNININEKFHKQIHELKSKALLQENETHIKKTKKGLFLLNEILITFI